MTTKTKAASLVLDYKLYPRHQLDPKNLTAITRSLQAGATLPPVVIDAASRRVIDGFHRVTATLRAYGDEALIDVDERSFASEGDMFVEAARLNATHGVRLSPYDQARCFQVAIELDVDQARMATALSVTADIGGELRKRKTALDPDGQPVAIKSTLRHLAQTQLTERQMRGNERASGNSVRFHALQLVNAIENDIVPWSDEGTRIAFGHLAALLEKEEEEARPQGTGGEQTPRRESSAPTKNEEGPRAGGRQPGAITGTC